MTDIPFVATGIPAFDTGFRGARRQPEPVARETFDLILEGFGEEPLSPQDEEPAGTNPDPALAEVIPENRPDMFFLSVCMPPVQRQEETDRAPLPKLLESVHLGQATHHGETDDALLARPAAALLEGFSPAREPIETDTPKLPVADTAVDLKSADARKDGEAAGVEAPRLAERAGPAICTVERPSSMDTPSLAPEHPDPGPTFAPSPALQILQQIDRLLSGQAGPTSSPSSVQQLHMAGPPVVPVAEVKSLHFMLQPENLGDVEVMLRRTGLETKVTITVTGKVAAEALGRDMSILEDKLGGLLATGPGGSVIVLMEVRNAEPATTQNMQHSEELGSDSEALMGGRGFGQDGRSGTNSDESPDRLSRSEPNVEDPSTGLAVGVGRVV